MASPDWEVQKVLVAQLKADSTFMNLISDRIYDEPNTNLQYPYVVVGDAIENPDNNLARNGFETYLNFDIYTKPAGLGFYTAKQIQSAIDTVLNMKRFTMTGFTMIICMFDNAITDRDGDKRIISARYKVISQDNNKL